jgi:hypothetical protein
MKRYVKAGAAGFLYGGLGAFFVALSFAAFCALFLPHLVVNRPFFIDLMQSLLLITWSIGFIVISISQFLHPHGTISAWMKARRSTPN